MRLALALTALLSGSALAQGADTLSRRDSVVQQGSALTADSPAGAVWDMDVRSYETQERVQHYVNLFTGKAKERITQRLEEGSRFEQMIRAQFRAGGIPEDMYYLALIESGFNPDAYSKAAAVGMWQFMATTARGAGLRVDWWVDERRDPVKSTGAAMRFLRSLSGQFKSLYLAAAAYNGGPGRVARGVKKYGVELDSSNAGDAFFLLADTDFLKRETRDYVPQLIAAALIAKEPARYGMELRSLDPYAYDSVTVAGGVPLAAIALAAAAPVSAISALNPQLLRGMTPPRDSTTVRIPLGAGLMFDSLFAGISNADLIATRRIETKKGETPARVALRNGIRIESLKAFNPKMRRLKNGNLAPGQELLIPTAAVADAARDVPDPAIEKYPKSRKAPKARASRKGKPAAKVAAKGKLAKSARKTKATSKAKATGKVTNAKAPKRASSKSVTKK